MTASRVRSAALVSAILPGLPSLATRSVAGLLRDGVPARVEQLDAIEPTVSAALLRATTLPGRLPCVAALAGRGAQRWLALHHRASVEVAATGGHDLSPAPLEVHRDRGGDGSAPGGLGGVLTGAFWPADRLTPSEAAGSAVVGSGRSASAATSCWTSPCSAASCAAAGSR